jgi:hypothetical protein
MPARTLPVRGIRALVCRKRPRTVVSAFAVFALWLAFLAFRSQSVLTLSPLLRHNVPVTAQRRVLTADGLVDVGQPQLRISRNCSSNRWYDLELDGQCYRSQEANVLAVTGGDYLSTAVRCWGYAPPLEYPLHPLPNSALFRVDVYAAREPLQTRIKAPTRLLRRIECVFCRHGGLGACPKCWRPASRWRRHPLPRRDRDGHG